MDSTDSSFSTKDFDERFRDYYFKNYRTKSYKDGVNRVQRLTSVCDDHIWDEDDFVWSKIRLSGVSIIMIGKTLTTWRKGFEAEQSRTRNGVGRQWNRVERRHISKSTIVTTIFGTNTTLLDSKLAFDAFSCFLVFFPWVERDQTIFVLVAIRIVKMSWLQQCRGIRAHPYGTSYINLCCRLVSPYW